MACVCACLCVVVCVCVRVSVCVCVRIINSISSVICMRWQRHGCGLLFVYVLAGGDLTLSRSCSRSLSLSLPPSLSGLTLLYMCLSVCLQLLRGGSRIRIRPHTALHHGVQRLCPHAGLFLSRSHSLTRSLSLSLALSLSLSTPWCLTSFVIMQLFMIDFSFI